MTDDANEIAAKLRRGAVFYEPEAAGMSAGDVNDTETDALMDAAADLIARLTARVAELEEPWRPIDDEARDGDLYELLRDNESVEIGYWHLASAAAARPDLGPRFPWAIVDTTQDTGWNGLMDNHHGPTHYRRLRTAKPLPPAPDTKE